MKKEKKHLGFKIIFFLLLLIVAVYFYGTNISTSMIKANEYKIKVNDLPDNFEGFKIVQFSDVLYGTNFGEENLKKLVDKINETNPDIVVFTGDLINKNNKMTTEQADTISEILSEIEADGGKYAINGDNDYKFDEWQNIIKNSGFTNLNNTYDTIYKDGYNYLLIAGASTFADKESINDKLNDTIEYINTLETGGPVYKILLMHEPDYINDLNTNPFDLILAGHSLGGQIKLPGIGAVDRKDGAQKYTDGYYKLENSELYVTSGLGNENYKFRLFNTPEINIYRLVK